MAKKPSEKDTVAESPKQDEPASGPAEGAAAAGGGQETEMLVAVITQYTKDLSFEVPGAPGIFALMQTSAPDINININVNAGPAQDNQDNMFEVALEIQAECKVNEQMAFILELDYAGLFNIKVPDEHLQAILLIECPRLLFPFARNILADVSRDGGFPPLMLGPVDFAQMYRSKIEELARASGGNGGVDSN